MQTRIGKSTGTTGHGRSRGTKANWQKIACFSLIFFFGCATFQKPDQKSLKNNLNRICFSTEGRGRVGLSSKKFGFDFESLLNKDQKKWAIDFHFPGGLEKIIEVDYQKTLKKQKESFKKLLRELNQEEFNDFFLGEFWEKMSQILSESEKPSPKLDWNAQKDKFIISFPPVKGYFFRFEASDLDVFFRRIKILIEREREISGPPLQIELFLDNCSAN